MSSRPRVVFGFALGLALAAIVGCSKGSSSSPAGGSGDPAATDQAEAGSGRKIVPMKRPLRPGDPSADQTDRRDRPDGSRPRMAQFDKDGDGQLSDDERAAMMAARSTAMLARLDSDADGKLTPAELEASPMARRLGDFAAADTDKNGTLSAAELGAALTAQMKKAGFSGWRGPRGDGSGSAADRSISTAPDGTE